MIRRFLLGFILALLCASASYGQSGIGGYPMSYFAKGLPIANRVVLQLPDSIQRAIKADTVNDKWRNRVAFAIATDINLATDGRWSNDGNRGTDGICRLKLVNVGARALSVKFKGLEIHGDGQLFVYNEDMSELLGAFNRGNNGNGDLLTDYIGGDSIVIEFNGSKEEAVNVKISEVVHFYKDIEAVNGADICEVNVMCPEGDNYRKQMNSVVQILTKVRNHYYNCTGTLVNNTKLDKSPYILTAFHCAHDDSGNESLPGDYGDWIFTFNYQYNKCNNGIGYKGNKMYGASFVASANWRNSSDIGTDFLLLKLNENIPSDFNVFYCGWDRSGIVKSDGVAMHHPQGDYKKISTFTTPLVQTNYPNGGLSMGFWGVKWSQTISGHGVTEGGSSGCGLLSKEGLLIGTLTGGRASCANTKGDDYFGMFSKSWESNGTEVNRKLSPWLDPIGSGTYMLSGLAGDNSINELDSRFVVKAYPNPANEYIIVDLPQEVAFREVHLIDRAGRKIEINDCYNDDYKLIVNTSHVGSGIYVLRILFDGGVYRNIKISVVK